MKKKKFVKKGNHKRYIPEFVIVYAHNSEALYVNGELYTQKRRITERDIMLAMDMMFIEVDRKWLHGRRHFPGRYVDIPFKKLR